MGIPFQCMEAVNKRLEPLVQELELNQGVKIENPHKGYPSAGTRNVSACIGNQVCQFANYNTTEFARKVEKSIFPNDYHVKRALSGCPNDCIKAHMQDFGILGMTKPEYEVYRCISCEACVKNCSKNATGALKVHNGKVKRDEHQCIGCGECVLKCPTSAWTRNPEKYYKLLIMGRTGKKNPRLAKPFLEWVDEASIIKIIQNTYEYIDEFIDRTLPKEHVGYIVDRTGEQVFKEYALKDVNLGCEVKEYL
ncbi:anaerobic sulfite reductase subunit C [Desulfitispora alkaliphila]